MKFAPEVEKALQELTNKLKDRFPEVADLLSHAQEGGLDVAEVMVELMQLVAASPEMAAEIEQMGMEAFAPARRQPLTVCDTLGITVELDGEDVPVIVQTGPGLANLNPLYEADLAERLQFDLDIPEARTMPLPPGQLPAVPVETTSRNMAAIGHMLETASEEVMGELAQGRALAADQVVAELESMEEPKLLGGGFHKAGDQVEAEVTTLEDWEGSTENVVALEYRRADVEIARGVDQRFINMIRANEPEGYRTGHLPTRRTVEEPSGGFLASMTPEDKRQATWKALSTTQGRRTALGGIAEVIALGLANHGVELIIKPVDSGRLDPQDAVVAYEEWTVQMVGPNATASQFSFIDTAGKALLAKLVSHDLENLDPTARLEVFPVNTVNVRQVGWAARIVTRG